MGIKPPEISKALYGNNGPKYWTRLWHSLLKKHLHCLPRTSAQLRKELTGVWELSAEDFGYAEDEMAVRDCLDHFLTQPFSEFYEGDIIVINPYLKPEHDDYVVVSNEEGEATSSSSSNSMAEHGYSIL
ncbi:MAG: hypothetical protein JSW12_01555 [Deltaproteobacteria bacterium]|nr:MAG: hypothetical protein JSW12_01555 [Deltaproteobacteria bacterium]